MSVRFVLSLGAVVAAALALAARAEPGALTIVAPSELAIGFAGAELAIPMRLRNAAPESATGELSSRVYQRSSSTLQPLGAPEPWWRGTLEPAQEVLAPLKVVLPELPNPAAYRIRILEAGGKALGYADAIGIPRGWLAAETKALGKALVLCARDTTLGEVFSHAGISLQRIDSLDPVAPPIGKLVLLIPTPEEEAHVARIVAQLGASHVRAILFLDHAPAPDLPKRVQWGAVSDLRELASSAGAQYRFITLLKQAIAAGGEDP